MCSPLGEKTIGHWVYHIPFHGNALVLIVGGESDFPIQIWERASELMSWDLIHNILIESTILTILNDRKRHNNFLIEKIIRNFLKEKVFSHKLSWGKLLCVAFSPHQYLWNSLPATIVYAWSRWRGLVVTLPLFLITLKMNAEAVTCDGQEGGREMAVPGPERKQHVRRSESTPVLRWSGGCYPLLSHLLPGRQM